MKAKILAVLDRIDKLLRGEPARLIGYSAAAVVVIVVQIANHFGISRLGTGLTLDEALAYATLALGFLVVVVEGIRKFVFSPDTFFNALMAQHAESFASGHLHAYEGIMAEAASKAAVTVAPAPDGKLAN